MITGTLTASGNTGKKAIRHTDMARPDKRDHMDFLIQEATRRLAEREAEKLAAFALAKLREQNRIAHPILIMNSIQQRIDAGEDVDVKAEMEKEFPIKTKTMNGNGSVIDPVNGRILVEYSVSKNYTKHALITGITTV